MGAPRNKNRGTWEKNTREGRTPLRDTQESNRSGIYGNTHSLICKETFELKRRKKAETKGKVWKGVGRRIIANRKKNT